MQKILYAIDVRTGKVVEEAVGELIDDSDWTVSCQHCGDMGWTIIGDHQVPCEHCDLWDLAQQEMAAEEERQLHAWVGEDPGDTMVWGPCPECGLYGIQHREGCTYQPTQLGEQMGVDTKEDGTDLCPF